MVRHPLVQHKLTLLRSKDTSTRSFRELFKEIDRGLYLEIRAALVSMPVADKP
ncbi:uracil phosphoribosyltransferase [Bradyrhizobium sp. UFLA03-84]|uniref:uracil phosphoribosyltransferase n=1 Tax=Bradyrhizobium sp. UFLA03-84 TaxID=418599 RepID=UPI0032E022D2